MVRIRLRRFGQRNRPFYRIVVTDRRRARDGKYLEAVGHYNPRDKSLALDLDRVGFWLARGAQPSATADRLICRFRKRISSVTTSAQSVQNEAQTPSTTTTTPEGGSK